MKSVMNQAKLPIAELRIAVQAALNDDWHTAHNIAQEYSDPIANWIHAVLHKIEGDVWNSKSVSYTHLDVYKRQAAVLCRA